MNVLLVQVLQKFSGRIVMYWGLFVLLDLAIGWVAKVPFIFFSSIMGAIFFSMMIGQMSMQSGWTSLWRRMAPNIKTFWAGALLVQALNICLIGLCYVVSSRFVPDAIFAPYLSQMTIGQFLWLFLILITCQALFISDFRFTAKSHLSIQRSQGLYIVKTITLLLMGTAILTESFQYSTFLGLLILEILLILIFSRNYFFVFSFTETQRKKIISTAITAIVILASVHLSILKKTTKEPSEFLGRLGPQTNYHFTDLAKITSPSNLALWIQSIGELDTDQVIATLDKIETLCPDRPTDRPSVIVCFEKEPKVSSVKISTIKKEAAILRLLDEKNPYAKLLGLISARNLQNFSPEIKSKIELLSQKPGRMGLVAATTLNGKKSAMDSSLKVLIISD